MPTMRNGPGDVSSLRNVGQKPKPFVEFGERAFLYYQGVEVKPQTVYAMERIAAEFFKRGLPVIWTSIVRAEFSRRFSLHPHGYGVDAVSNREILVPLWQEIGQAVAKDLGGAYDVLVHDDGTGLHLHTEFDPENDDHWTLWKETAKRDWEERHAQTSIA